VRLRACVCWRQQFIHVIATVFRRAIMLSGPIMAGMLIALTAIAAATTEVCGYCAHADLNAAHNLELLKLAGVYGLRSLKSSEPRGFE